ncbi:MAG: nitroreductase family protein, partial [Bifidobacteriaceae bacterium]|jgi:nitroreductase|nr:nitroreductase family protein [Bifidobacteriaceae bacterium]
MGLVKMHNGVAALDEANEEVCIYCDQCVAVCPPGAMSLHVPDDAAQLAELDSYGIIPLELTAADLKPLESVGSLPKPEQFEALVATRRTVRAYQDTPVDHATIEHLVHDVLVNAPTGHNVRGLKAVVVEGRDKIEHLTDLSMDGFARLAEDQSWHSFDRKVFARLVTAWREQHIDRIFRTAHQAIFTYCKTSIPPRDPAILLNLAYFQLAAWTRGIGTAWAGYFMIIANDPAIKAYLGVADDESIHGAVMFGYPQWDFPRLPQRPDIGLSYR